MRFHFLSTFLFLMFNGGLLQGQIVTVKIEDFVNQHNGFEENEEGEEEGRGDGYELEKQDGTVVYRL